MPPFELVSPPKKIDSRFFNPDGTANDRLRNVANKVREDYQLITTSEEEMLGMYVVGSSAKGNFHDNSDLDINIWGKVGYSRGTEISNALCDMSNQLTQHFPKLREMGIDPENPDINMLQKLGLMAEDEKQPSLIKALDRLGVIKKADMIDVVVFGQVPWGQVFDLKDEQWKKYRDGTQESPGSLSNYFKHGF